jgi:hypothetical protein
MMHVLVVLLQLLVLCSDHAEPHAGSWHADGEAVTGC